MKKASRDENRAGAGISIRFSVLLLAISMLIAAPVFAYTDEDAAGGTSAPAKQAVEESDTDGTDTGEEGGNVDEPDSGTGEDPSEIGSDKQTNGSSGALKAPVLRASAVGPTPFGNGTVSWEITNDGALVIKPAGTRDSGRISNINNGGTNPNNARWPWLANAYRNQITTVRFEGVVGTEPNVDLNYMFANLTNLTSVDFSNFTQSNPGGSQQTDTTRNMRGMFYGCTKLEEIKGVENLTSSRVTDTAQMFYNCKALKAGGFMSSDGTAATEEVNGKEHADFAWINTAKVETMKEMFYGSGLDYVYMGDNKNDNAVWEMQDMFAGSSVVSVVINNEGFVTRASTASDGSVTSGSVQMQRMFGGCKSLEYIDMSNITIYGRDNWNQLNMMLKDESGNNGTPNLKTVKLNGTKVPNMKRLDGVFDGCKSLETVELDGFVPSDAVTMRNMFRNCTSLKSLDVSSFGKLDHIVNMDGFVSGCTSLETLNIDNLDNSRIEPRMGFHQASHDDKGAAAVNVDWGRELGIDSCTALTTISAQNSKVWMVKNNKGSAASGMYWMAENDNAIYYFTNKQMKLEADIGVAVDITTKRDYVDLLTDRHETGDRANGKQEWETNKNMPTESGTHVNKNGEGFLPPGVYTLKADTTLGDEAQPFQDSYYRITGIKSKEPEVTFDKTKFRLIPKGYDGQPHNSIDTKVMGGEEIRALEPYTGTAERPLITVRYKDGAKDINGKTHDLVMKITKITFTDLDKIPENPGRNHEQNIYLDKWGTYSRAIMEYDTGYVALKNYILTEYDRSFVMKGSSGMEIEFTIGVEDALPDTSVLFYLNDLDVMKDQKWTEGKNKDGEDDACYDTLDWKDVTYGEGSEGIKLQTGNDLNTLKFANHTGLAIIDGNYIVGTGHDPSTSWSAFSVRANAKQSKYTWTSGIGCTTEVLKETPVGKEPAPVYVIPEATKLVNSTVPKGSYKEQFEFNLVPASEVTSVEAVLYKGTNHEETVTLANSATSEEAQSGVKNDGSVVPFKELGFPTPRVDGNKHAADAYVYKITENIPSEPGDVITYNRSKVIRFIKVIVSDPQSDLEMEKGTRADVTVGEYRYSGEQPPETVPVEDIIWDESDTRTVWSADAQPTGEVKDGHTVFLDESGKKFYRDKGKFLSYADGNELTAAKSEQVERVVTYEDKEYTVRVDRDGVRYIKIPKLFGSEYRDPDSFKVLRETKAGEVYPEDSDKSSAVPKKSVTGETVRIDVHGKQYYLKGGKYYDPANDDPITVKDGVFNPDASSDRLVYTDEIHGGNKVYEDSEGTKYYYTGSGSERKYYDLNDHVLNVGSKGEVTPSRKDKTETSDRKDDQFLMIKGHMVYRDRNNIRYYRVNDKYYDVVGTILEPGDGFEPDQYDDRVKQPFDIMEEEINGKTVRFYKSDDKYYTYTENDDFSGPEEFTFPDYLLDTSEAVNVGEFNNVIKTSSIKIVNKTVDNKAGDFTFYIGFDNSFHPTDVEFSPARPQDGQFDLVTSGEYKGCYKFTLSEGQAVTIKKVPIHTTYTVTEPVEANGWELVSIAAGDLRGSNAAVNRSVTKEITTEKVGDYTHTFTNRFTELIADKTIRVKTGETRDTDKVFEFTASVTVKELTEGEEFSYGWMQEAENQKFYIAKADTAGSKTVSMDFTLKHGEDIDLVVPQGADVTVTEKESSYLASTRVDKGSAEGHESEVGTQSAEASNVQDSDKYKLHFFNQLVTPVSYDQVRVEKVIKNHPWMSGYGFEMALIPVGYLDSEGKVVPVMSHTPMPENTVHYDSGIYASKFVQQNEAKQITGLPADEVGYWDLFDSIKYTNDDMVVMDGGKWTQTEQKTFVYSIRELTPQEGSATESQSAPGLTYSTEKYEVDIKVHLDKEGSKLELVVDGQKIYKLTENDTRKEVVSAARFTNKFDPENSAYRMTADKVLTRNDDTVELGNGDYQFTLRPVGENAAIAPMPKDTKGTGAGRYITVSNVHHMIRFLDNNDPDDGLSFKHADLIKPVPEGAGLTDEQLRQGVVFDYEMNEVIPEPKDGETRVNNGDGTWTIVDAEGNMHVYDGIYHIRSLKVQLVPETDGDVTREIISVTNIRNDQTRDSYVDKNGDRQNVSKLEDYDPEEHHTQGGAPIFHNLYIKEGHASLKIVKKWEDHANMSEIRPDVVNVKVISDDPDVADRTVTVEKAEGWETVVEDLPIYSHKYDRTTGELTKITYTLEEVIEGSITGDEKTGYKASYIPESITLDENSETTAEVKITNTHVPADGKAENAETWGLKGEVQTGRPDYHVTPHNPVTPEELLPASKPGSTISDDKKTVMIPGEGEYRLNKDGTITFTPDPEFLGDPEPIIIKGRDRLDKESTVGYIPHVIDPVDENEVSRTLHFTYEKKTGDKVIDDIVQKVTLSRKAIEVNPRTGEVVLWGDWSKGTFPAVDNPDAKAGEGWYTTDKVDELTIEFPIKVADVHVVYHKKVYTVTFKDGDHGKSSGGTARKEYGDTPQANKVRPDDGWKFTGIYEYVITDESGKVIASGKTDDPSSIRVTGNIVFTPLYEADPNGGGGGGSHRGSGMNTGDSNAIVPLACMAGVCLAALIALIVMRRRRSR